jgi:hypothetical protein
VTPTAAASLRPRRLAAGFLFGVGVGLLVVMANLAATRIPPPGERAFGYVVQTSPPHNRIEVILNQGDGQAAMAIGQDPSLARPDAFLQGAPAAAFFAQRPLLGYLAWVGSVGQPGLTAWAVAGVTVLSAGALAVAAMAFAQLRGAGSTDRWALMVLVLPGALTVLDWTGPDLLALAMALVGLACWIPSRPRRGWAALAFVLAGLSRESLLLVPVVLGLWLLYQRRLDGRRDLWPLGAAPAAYLAWMLVVRLRLGTGPEQVARQTSFSLPFVDLVHHIGGFGPVEWLVAAVGLGLVAAAVVRAPRDVCAWMAVAYLAAGTALNSWLWESWQGFSRVLLPMYAFSILALLPTSVGAALTGRSPRTATDTPSSVDLPFSAPDP